MARPSGYTLLLKLTDNATVYGTTTPDGLQVFSVYDFISKVYQKQKNCHARCVWKRLTSTKSNYKDEVVRMTYDFFILNPYIKNQLNHAQSNVQIKTPGMTLVGLSSLLVILHELRWPFVGNHKVDADFQKIVDGLLTRAMNGDTSMIEEIDPIPNREALDATEQRKTRST